MENLRRSPKFRNSCAIPAIWSDEINRMGVSKEEADFAKERRMGSQSLCSYLPVGRESGSHFVFPGTQASSPEPPATRIGWNNHSFPHCSIASCQSSFVHLGIRPLCSFAANLPIDLAELVWLEDRFLSPRADQVCARLRYRANYPKSEIQLFSQFSHLRQNLFR